MNKNQEPDDVPAAETDDRYSSAKTLIKLASWANLLSWAILTLNAILFIGRLIFEFIEGWNFEILTVFNFLFYLSSLVVGIIWYVVLQAISEGIYLWLDIEENTRMEE